VFAVCFFSNTLSIFFFCAPAAASHCLEMEQVRAELQAAVAQVLSLLALLVQKYKYWRLLGQLRDRDEQVQMCQIALRQPLLTYADVC
jgi:hypothetical protein